MGSHGIRDRVAIVGMGCTAFGESWDKGVDELIAEAAYGALANADVEKEQIKEVLTRIAWKNHHNGALNPRAQFRREVAKEAIACSPNVAGPLGIMDCSGVSDGAAAAVIVRSEDAHRFTDKPLYVKALALAAGPRIGPMNSDYDYTTFEEVTHSAQDAYQQAAVRDPAADIA